MDLHGTLHHDHRSSSAGARIGARPAETESHEREFADQDAGLVPSEAMVDALDQEDFRAPVEIKTTEKPIVSVHGQDVDEEDLGKAA